MGLIKAGLGAVDSVLADQWKEYFYCDAMDKNTLVVKGQKRTSGRSSNTKGSDNIISNGSVISVANGQCMMIVEQGKVVEVSAEPGEFTWDASTEPSIFAGSLGKSILETFKTVGKRFTFGGDTGKDQRVYYFNTLELLDNKFGTPNPIPFRVVDHRLNLDLDTALRCSGTYSFRIADPLTFYSKVCGNVSDRYDRSEIESTLKHEFIAALQPALGKLSDLEMRPNQIITHTADLEAAMNTVLSQKWGADRGLEVASIALSSVTLPDEDAQAIKNAQQAAMYKDPTMAGAATVAATNEAMKIAAGNSAGAVNGFMGMGMFGGMGGGPSANIQNLYAMGAQQQAQQPAPAPAAAPAAGSWKCSCGATATGKFCPECGSKKPEPPKVGGWTCKCGNVATGKFCPECGAPKPAEDGWTCSCGTVNKGKFCSNCGAKKPAGVPTYKCDKCGWEPEDPTNPPKFCPECGDLFDDRDIK